MTLNVRPKSTGFNAVDCGGANSESLANLAMGELSGRYHRPNDRDLRFSEFCQAVLGASIGAMAEYVPRVAGVLGWCHVLKVRQAVVKLIAVFVVDLLPWRAVAQKCFSDKSMDADRAVVDADSQVAVPHTGLQDHSCLGARPVGFAPNATKSGDGIVTDPAPFFGFDLFGGKLLFGHWGHLLERLSSWLERLEGSQSFGPFAHCTINYEVTTS